MKARDLTSTRLDVGRRMLLNDGRCYQYLSTAPVGTPDPRSARHGPEGVPGLTLLSMDTRHLAVPPDPPFGRLRVLINGATAAT